MSYGFRIFSGHMITPPKLAESQQQVVRAEEELTRLRNLVWDVIGEIHTKLATYGRKAVVNISSNSWRDAEFYIDKERMFQTDWASTWTRPVELGRTPADEQTIDNQIYADFHGSRNSLRPRLNRAIEEYNQYVYYVKQAISYRTDQEKSARVPIFDSTTTTWSQVDMFLVPAGLTAERSFPDMGFTTFMATQMFVNSHPKDGVGAAGKGMAALVEVRGYTVKVSGGNRDTYIMVIAQ